MFSTTYLDQMGLCRLCLIREKVDISIFEVNQLPTKINVCLPVKIASDDKLPKKICVDCFYKLESFYQFYNITAKAEQQLLSWLGEETKVQPVEQSENVEIPHAPVSELLKVCVKEEAQLNVEDDDDDRDDFFDSHFKEDEEPSTSLIEPKAEPLKTPKVKKTPPPEKKRKKKGTFNRKLRVAGRLCCLKVNDKEYVCTECDERFTRQLQARTHFKEKHVEEDIFKCEHCDKIFNKAHGFMVHRAREHGMDKNAPIFFCDKCDFKTAFKTYYKAHIARKHTEGWLYDCHHCAKKFKLKSDMAVHMSIHEGTQHMCDFCGKLFPSYVALVHHRRVKHINCPEFVCPVCNFKCVSQANLDNHIRDNHDPNNPHKCNECGQQFKIKRYLLRHQKRVHEKLKKTHLCQVCGKSFVCPNTYRIHYLTHTNIKPYLCNVCGNSFSQRSSLMLHWKTKHPDAEVPPPPPIILTDLFDTLQLDKGCNIEAVNPPINQSL